MIKLIQPIRFPVIIFVLASISTIISCTTVPTKEFATYKEAFSQARSAGEEVLFDYAAAVKEYEKEKAIKAKEKQSSKKSEETPGKIKRPRIYDPVAAASPAAEIDHIAVRMKAWDTVARYNDVLTGLAEGKSVQK